MGNYGSCTLANPIMKNSKAARVIFPGGEVRQFREPIKAAEVMLESPNFFLANSRSLHIGRRFSALSADEDLEFGNVYIMFPMKRVNSVVVAADMAVLFMAANAVSKRISAAGNLQISREHGDERQETAAETQIGGEFGERGGGLEEVEGFPVAEYKYRLGVCRSRKPLLETIKEEGVCSRRDLKIWVDN